MTYIKCKKTLFTHIRVIDASRPDHTQWHPHPMHSTPAMKTLSHTYPTPSLQNANLNAVHLPDLLFTRTSSASDPSITAALTSEHVCTHAKTVHLHACTLPHASTYPRGCAHTHSVAPPPSTRLQGTQSQSMGFFTFLDLAKTLPQGKGPRP